MSLNKLKLNDDKTKVGQISCTPMTTDSSTSVTIDSDNISSSAYAKNLGVTLEQNISMSHHTSTPFVNLPISTNSESVVRESTSPQKNTYKIRTLEQINLVVMLSSLQLPPLISQTIPIPTIVQVPVEDTLVHHSLS